ncbi:MAG: protein kinase [Vicinamibacterales bacterium]
MDNASTGRWQRIEGLFSSLVDAPSGERARALAEAAGTDAELAATVEGMLAHADAGARLHQAVDAVAASLTDAPGHLPERFGAFRVVREVGRGGMGVVYEGVSDDEFARGVAVKMAPLAAVGAAADARFRLERQILSSLDHPHIARFLDAGTEGALPYLVMEFVHGEPITAYVQRKALPLADRLRLVQKLCGALQYAHQRLVVHRDLKPSNILVTEDGTPKLLDFGVAKLLDAGGGPSPTLGALAWTPDYASPEQVTGDIVGTPSDIYSLGLVLYEVLTGARAQVPDTTSPLALSRSVCEVEPPGPSETVAASGDAVTARRLRGEIDTIVMTAIHKDPARRYASAAAVADDIERYLTGLPVAARAGSIWYRARKAAARHRGAAVAAALLTTAVVGGFASTVYQARRADRRFQQVRALATEFVFGVHDRIAALPGSTEARRALVQTALTYLENLREDAAADPGLAKEVAAAYVKIGRVQGHPLESHLGDPDATVASFERARELLAPLEAAGDIEARLQLARLELLDANLYRAQGDLPTTMARFERARILTDQLFAARPTDESTLELVGEVYSDIARTSVDRRHPAEAVAASTRALQAAEALTKLRPDDAHRQDNLATAYNAVGSVHVSRGELTDAVANFRRAVEIRDALLRASPNNADVRRGLAVALGNVGDILGIRSGENLGDFDGAAAAAERAVTLSRENVAADPKDRRATFDLVSALMRLGAAFGDMPGRAAAAIPILEEATRMNSALMAQNPAARATPTCSSSSTVASVMPVVCRVAPRRPTPCCTACGGTPQGFPTARWPPAPGFRSHWPASNWR